MQKKMAMVEHLPNIHKAQALPSLLQNKLLSK